MRLNLEEQSKILPDLQLGAKQGAFSGKSLKQITIKRIAIRISIDDAFCLSNFIRLSHNHNVRELITPKSSYALIPILTSPKELELMVVNPFK